MTEIDDSLEKISFFFSEKIRLERIHMKHQALFLRKIKVKGYLLFKYLFKFI